jgi:hypothetical protein
MSICILFSSKLLTWARERAGLDTLTLTLTLAGHLPKLLESEAGEVQTNSRQLENSTRAVHVSAGYLFLPAPPQEPLPIPGFRSVKVKAAIASQIIAAATEVWLIKPDESVGRSRKFARYLPFWA